MLSPGSGGAFQRLDGHVDATQALGGGTDAQVCLGRRRDRGRALKGRERLLVLAQNLGDLTAGDVGRGQVGRRGRGLTVVAERLSVGAAICRRAADGELATGARGATAGGQDTIEHDDGAHRSARSCAQLRDRNTRCEHDERDEEDTAEEQDDQNPRAAARRRSSSHCSVLPVSENRPGTIVAFSARRV